MLRAICGDTDEKVVVVSEHRLVLKTLKAFVSAEFPGLACAINDGKVTSKRRAANLKELNSGRLRVLLLSKGTAEGVTCVGASHMIELGTSWNPSVDDQALGRIHRFGQRRPCYVYRVVAQGSIDELVLHRQATKSSLCGLLKSKKFPTRSDPDRAAVFDVTDESVASRLWAESSGSRASDAAPTVNDHGAPRAAEATASVCEYANPDLWDAIDPRATESPFGSGPLEALRLAPLRQTSCL